MYKIKQHIIRLLNEYVILRFNIIVDTFYMKPLTKERELRYFKTKNVLVYLSYNLDIILEN